MHDDPPLDPEARKEIERKCYRDVLDNLKQAEKQIGRRSRLRQMIQEYGVVATWRQLAPRESTGWTELYEAGLLKYSMEATIVEKLAFRTLFTIDEITRMESELRVYDYAPRAPT